MKLTQYCEECLLRSQRNRCSDPEYLQTVKTLLDQRDEKDTAPYMVYLFNQEYKKRFGSSVSYKNEKKQYNGLVLSMEKELTERINGADDPLLESILLARTGNYIDYGAMNHVDADEFLSLFDDVRASREDLETYSLFLRDCKEAKTFCLIADNCGEIVLDRIMCGILQKRFPWLDIKVMVRGEEVLNDACFEDALLAGFESTQIIPNGNGCAGTVDHLLTPEAKELLTKADVVLAKGQGNYETLSGINRRVYYSFLCKCPLFVTRFKTERLSGIFRMEDN